MVFQELRQDIPLNRGYGESARREGALGLQWTSPPAPLPLGGGSLSARREGALCLG